MEVTLKIEAAQLGETVVDLFKNLGEDQRKAIATDILIKWLNEPYNIEREAYAEGVLRDFRQSNIELYINYNRKRAADCTDKEIKDSSEYRDRIRNFKSSRELMIKEITTEVMTHFKTSIPELIKTDPKFEILRSVFYQFIVDNFPMMIKESFANYFTSQLNMIVINSTATFNNRSWFEASLQDMKNKLKQNYNLNVE